MYGWGGQWPYPYPYGMPMQQQQAYPGQMPMQVPMQMAGVQHGMPPQPPQIPNTVARPPAMPPAPPQNHPPKPSGPPPLSTTTNTPVNPPPPPSTGSSTGTSSVTVTSIPMNTDSKIDAAAAVSSFLNMEADTDRKTELLRIVNSFKLNPFDVLNMPLNCTTPEVNKQYRDLSLLVHPDKYSPDERPEAEKAFTILTAAKNELLDETKRGHLNELIKQARQKVVEAKDKEFKETRKKEVAEFKAKNPGAILPEKAIPDFEKQAGYEEAVKAQFKELLIDREWRTRQLLKMASQEEMVAAQVKEQKADERKAKEQTEQEWEANRDKRVGSWRTWMQGKTPGGKKRLRQPKLPKLTAEDSSKTYIKRLKTKNGAVGTKEDDEDDEDNKQKKGP